MKKVFLLALFAFGIICIAEAQRAYVDSLKQELNKAKEDTNKVKLYTNLTGYYMWDYPDSSLSYGIPGLQLARELDFLKGDLEISWYIVEAYSGKGNYPKALQIALKALQLAEKSRDLEKINLATVGVGNVYFYSKEYSKALDYYRKRQMIGRILFPKRIAAATLMGETFFNLGQLDSALYYLQIAYTDDIKEPPYRTPNFFYLGKVYAEMGQYDTALRYFREGLAVSEVKQSFIDGHIGIAEVFEKRSEHPASP